MQRSVLMGLVVVLGCSEPESSESVNTGSSDGTGGSAANTTSSQTAGGTSNTETTGADTTSSGGASSGSTDGPMGNGFGNSTTDDSTTATSSGGTMGSATGGSSGGMPSTSSAGGSSTGECVPRVECEPEALPSTGDYHQDCVDRVNQFRVECWCLPALERWTEGESCADQHAEYDSELDEAHAGFSDRICDESGRAQNECPGWNSEGQIVQRCLQMMYDEGPPPSDNCQGQCFQDHGHFINMTNERYTQVACGFYTTPGGDVWSVQNFQ